MTSTGIITNDGVFDYLSSCYLGWGTGNTPASKTDTNLKVPSSEARVPILVTQVSPGVYTVRGFLTSLSSQIIKEAGLFSQQTGGKLRARTVFTSIPVNTGGRVEITFNVTN